MNTPHDATKRSKQQASLSKKQAQQKVAAGKLLLIRHAESEWNVLGKWTGRTDVHLTPKGMKEASLLGDLIRDVELHHAYTSEQIRTVETLLQLLEVAGKASLPQERRSELNERDYGEYTGLNKWEVLEQLGEYTFTKIRRSWSHPIPGGETLQMVHERAVPFYKEHMLPKLIAGKNVIVVSHGNTIRSLIKYLENVSDKAIEHTEMPFGQILIYDVTHEGRHYSKEIRQINIDGPHA